MEQLAVVVPYAKGANEAGHKITGLNARIMEKSGVIGMSLRL